MTRLARAEVFAPDEIAIVHVMNRVVRRCLLFGDDPYSGRNYDHRRGWIEQRLSQLAAQFGIDLLSFAILSNHFHLLLRSRPDIVAGWDDTEVARRWLRLCPLRKAPDGTAAEPTVKELNSIRNAPEKLAELRSRLSDIAWWMRLLCQHIAQRANREDQTDKSEALGRFWQSRYRAVRLLDETAILACSAYIDLNIIRAAMAETLETSDYTSVQRRIAALRAVNSKDCPSVKVSAVTEQSPAGGSAVAAADSYPDSFLAPLPINALLDPLGPHPSCSGTRCSDKGWLPMTTPQYLALLDYVARQRVAGKPGSTAAEVPAIFQRLSLAPAVWCELIGDFGKLFSQVAGEPTVIEAARSRVSQRPYRISQRARMLMGSAA